MKFNAATTLHVRNPKHLGESPTHGVVSLYFRTTKANALLVYMGTGGGHQGEHHGEAAAAAAEREEDSEDFVALEIVGGKCVMRFELGAGVASISNDKLVNDAQWHEVIAERTGKTATLTVRTDGEDNVIAEGTAPGQFTSLNLDPETSVVYVGGASDTVSLPAQVANRRYTGCIESVSFNKQPLPLWNFVHAENLFEACKERDQLQVQQGASGYKFDGSGYVVVARGDFNPQDSADVTLEFRSFADAGLLIYGGKDRDFLALELIDGAVLFQYDMGSGRAQIRTNATYNDGAWHTVNARRFGREGLLLVDGEEAGSGVAPGSLTKLDIGDDVYIGGTLAPPTLRDVTARGLEGCIRNVQLGTTIVDMSINKDARGIVAGCPDTIVRVASFDGAQGSYTEHTDVTFGEQAALTFKFRTLQPTSLVMYAADAGQTHALSAQLLEGRVAVVHTSDDLSTVLQSNNNNYNDGEWHFVNILKDAGRLHIDIDEGDRKDQELSDAGPDHQAALWMAGVPTDYGITEGASLTLAAFSGCLGDITVNSK
ncbi:PREDICTED: laminin-like protein epi-1 [Priapulus caudatus]|uniref:Laminin-like protein epi-1 n=1 Tax=Priapulus caudatus TaxID=37621 RepID=A0ABM1EMJ0_PRICU|nr:PREDICTED: laminin-like protein epi-1 [Priapulus caudatus]